MAENTVELASRGNTPTDDRRARPVGPIRIGDIAALSVRTTHGGPTWKWEYVGVEVTHADRGHFRGEVVQQIHPALFPDDAIRLGSPVAFAFENVFEILDGQASGDPSSAREV